LANRILILPLLGMLAMPLRAELLKLSLLQKPAAPFTLKLDLFNSSRPAAGGDSGQAAQGQMPAAQAEALQKSIAEEIAQSITYIGIIVKNSKKMALLDVSGESFIVSEQDMILDKIRILKIGRETVTIEYDNQPYDIRIKGDQNG